MNENNETIFSLGDLVTTKNHPFFKDSTSKVIIKARAEFTPPILNIFEINLPEFFNENTGKKIIQYHCVYYDTKLGDFETRWFKENELKLIKSYEDINELDKEPNLINKQCILKSVDFELKKLKSNYESSFNHSSNKISAHLDFLPPLLEIIEIVNNGQDKNYDKKTGKKVKNNKQLKCKWYNPVKNTYSEKILPLNVLKLVELQDSNKLREIEKYINKDYYYCYKKDKSIIIASITNIAFNHYQYQIYGENLITGKVEELDINEIISKKPIPLKIEQPSTDSVYIDDEYPCIVNQEFKNISFDKGQHYFITYKDKLDRITKRIIKVESKLEIDIENKKVLILEAICYLRNKEKRHFKVNNILRAVKLNESLF